MRAGILINSLPLEFIRLAATRVRKGEIWRGGLARARGARLTCTLGGKKTEAACKTLFVLAEMLHGGRGGPVCGRRESGKTDGPGSRAGLYAGLAGSDEYAHIFCLAFAPR